MRFSRSKLKNVSQFLRLVGRGVRGLWMGLWPQIPGWAARGSDA